LIAGLAALAVPGLSAAQVYVGPAPSASDYAVDTDFNGGQLDDRLNGVEQQIRADQADGRLSTHDANHAFHDLNDIRYRETHFRNEHGGLTAGDLADLNQRIDGVINRVTGQARG
jgi:hypothetical protein